jgi:hypothetical protein
MSNDILRSRLKTYCDVNAFDLIALKANLEKPENAEFREKFQAELEEAVDGDTLTKEEYEALTGDEFEDDEAYDDFLTAVEVFLFEDGPHP